jgi:hypothetical protein
MMSEEQGGDAYSSLVSPPLPTTNGGPTENYGALDADIYNVHPADVDYFGANI